MSPVFFLFNKLCLVHWDSAFSHSQEGLLPGAPSNHNGAAVQVPALTEAQEVDGPDTALGHLKDTEDSGSTVTSAHALGNMLGALFASSH